MDQKYEIPNNNIIIITSSIKILSLCFPFFGASCFDRYSLKRKILYTLVSSLKYPSDWFGDMPVKAVRFLSRWYIHAIFGQLFLLFVQLRCQWYWGARVQSHQEDFPAQWFVEVISSLISFLTQLCFTVGRIAVEGNSLKDRDVLTNKIIIYTSLNYIKTYQNILEHFLTNLKFWWFWITDQSY